MSTLAAIIAEFSALAAPALPPIYVGVDPGLKGFVAELCGSMVSCTPAPVTDGRYDVAGIWHLVLSWRGRVRLVVLEAQQVFPEQQGAVSGFTTGLGYGYWRMALEASGVPFRVLRPSEWKSLMELPPPGKYMGDDPKKARGWVSKERKRLAVEAAQRLFPHVDFRASDKARTPHDGKCEAALMAELGRRLSVPG